MNIKLMDIRRQHEAHHDEIEDAVINVLRSGEYIGGKVIEDFENNFANYVGAKYCVSCGNGTDALVIALRALNIGNGDEVITTPFTFFATGEAIASVGAKPIFVDVDKDTYCIDPNLIEKAITKSTKAVLPVHIYGQSCDMDRLNDIKNKYGLYLITDCAQATGTEYKGSRHNIIGDVGCFSFFPTKNLGCDGDGGAIVTDNEKIATACSALKVHGSGKNGYLTFKNNLEEDNKEIPLDLEVGESKYNNYIVGYNSRLDAIQASVLNIKLKYIDEYISRRRDNAMLYNEKLVNTSYITPLEAKYSKHSYYIYALQCNDSKKIMELLNKNEIGNGVYYPVPLHLQGAFYDLGYKKGNFPIAEYLSTHTVALPIYPELSMDEILFVIKSLKTHY